VLLSCFSESAGKNPVPTEEIDQALSRLEILSVDTASVFSDELDTCPNKLAPGIDIDGDQDIIAPPRSSSPAPDEGFGSVRRRHSLNNGAPTSVRCDDGFVCYIQLNVCTSVTVGLGKLLYVSPFGTAT
jgi:hypothetical protein